MNLQEAMDFVVHEKLVGMDGRGGMIGADATGHLYMTFNTAGMYRAMKHSSGDKFIGIYND